MDLLYEQLKQRIEGNRHAVSRAGDIFMSMISRDVLRQLKNNEGCRLNADDLAQLFISQGIFFRQVTLNGQWWKHTTGRLLAFLKEDDAPVILSPDFASYSFIHPHTGNRCLVNQRTAKGQLLKPEAFCLTIPLPTGPLTMRDLGRFAWRSLSKTDLCYICLACVSVVLLTMFTPYVTKLVFSEVIPSGQSTQLLPVAVLLFSAAIGLMMLQVTRSLVVFRVKDKLEYTLQTALMTRLLHLPATFFKTWSTGDLSNRVLSLSRFSGMLTESMLTTMLSTLFTGILFIQFFIYGGPLLLIGIGVLAVMLFSILLNYYYTRKVQENVNPHRSYMYGLLYEILGGIQKIRVNGAEERAFFQWTKSFMHSEVNSASQPVMFFYSSSISYVVKLLPLLVTMWAAWYYKLGLSDYIAYCVVLGIAVGTVNQLGIITKQIGRVMPEVRQCSPILETPTEETHDQHVLTNIEGNIEMSSVSFRYSDTTPWIFKGLSLQIHSGEYVAIVGPSGCGKTTLMRLLLGFEEPNDGAIFYDHYNLYEINKSSLRQNCVGAVLQNGRLIEGTLLDNILFTAPAATEADAWEAARLVALDEDIHRMPLGMKTPVTEDGRGISGGQRQRILLARALVQQPDILLLDEATSALDNVTQQRVMDYLKQMHCTRITIAHRVETIRQCDRIIVISHGQVVKDGSYDELVAEGYL
jgi:NHLM bacteriocin system ABC transporter ATP-binding protein